MVRALVLLLLVAGCAAPTGPTLTGDDLLDPESCKSCHPTHYEQWSGSMHAYTGFDPVFMAQLRLGQEETGGELGDHCIGCHSPMAVREGATDDGLNLDEIEPYLRGITCAVCHLVDSVPVEHNAGLLMATDENLRGGILDPVENTAHGSVYSLVHDRNSRLSAAMCGTCHCVFNSNEVHVERTMDEWRETVFATGDLTAQTCSNCHMRGSDGPVATSDGAGGVDLPIRRMHDHSWPGVDVAAIEFPQRAEQKELIQGELDTSLLARLCVAPIPGGVEVVVRLENIRGGHSFPSGSTVDRRVWLELVASAGGQEVLSTGVVADDQPVTALDDPTLWLMRDRHFDADGNEVMFPWQTMSVESELLPAAVSSDPLDPNFYHYVERSWPLYDAIPDRVEMRVRMRAMGLEVLDELVQTAGLDPAVPLTQPTWELGSTVLTWEGEVGTCVPY